MNLRAHRSRLTVMIQLQGQGGSTSLRMHMHAMQQEMLLKFYYRQPLKVKVLLVQIINIHSSQKIQSSNH